MSQSTANLIIWSYGIAFFVYAFLFCYLLQHEFGKRPGIPGRTMLIALGLSSLWAITLVTAVFLDSTLFLRLHSAADVLRYGAWLASLLLCAVPQGKGLLSRLLQNRAIALTAGAFVVLSLGGEWVLLMGFGSVSLIHGLQLMKLGLAICGLALIEQLLRSSNDDGKWIFKPMGLGLAAVFAFDLWFFSSAALFNVLDEDLLAVRGFVVAMLVPLAAITIARNRNRALQLTLSQSAVFHSTTLMVVGVYLLFVSAAGYYVRYFGGEWGRALQLGLFSAALLALLLMVFSGSMRAKLRVIIGKHFFRYRYDYREEWLKFTTNLSAETDHHAVCLRVVMGLADMVESPAGALWLHDPASNTYQQGASWNVAESHERVSHQDPLLTFMLAKNWVFNLEEYRSTPSRYAGVTSMPAWLATIPDVWLVVPLIAGRDLIGFVTLSTARTHMEVDWEVNDLLKTASSQAASHIAQMLATEALLEAKKFDSFNRMSAFVVHDLKNIITQLSLMVKNADRHWDKPEFQQDMLMTVQNSVERMRQLMLQLRAGATPVPGTFGVKLGAIIERICAAKQPNFPNLSFELKRTLISRGHEERVERVIGHVIQNAIDATSQDGKVRVLLDQEEGMAMLQIEDTGHGMSQEFIRERLFKPFQSTKEAGMGIGAYESYQYVQELGGRLSVDSVEGQGTKVRLYLPLFESNIESGLQRLEIR